MLVTLMVISWVNRSFKSEVDASRPLELNWTLSETIEERPKDRRGHTKQLGNNPISADRPLKAA